jgi:hypothetical protein
MKYEIKKSGGDINISVAEVAGDKQRLLEAFRECQEGRCSCPTTEYKKLDALEITQHEAGVELRLKPKDGEVFDSSEIAKCLNYTAGKLKNSGGKE